MATGFVSAKDKRVVFFASALLLKRGSCTRVDCLFWVQFCKLEKLQDFSIIKVEEILQLKLKALVV